MKLPATIVAGLVGALAVAGAVAFHPGSGGPPAAALAASRASDQPGALAQFLRFGGSGSVQVHPDTAQIQVTTTGRAATSKQALDQASAAMQHVIARLKALGVADDDLQTAGVYSYRAYPKPRGYQASNSLSVTIHDVSQAGKLLAAANAAGADEVSGPSFSLADQHAAYRQALTQAIADARAKADAAAAQIGVHVTGVVSVSDVAQPGPVLPMAAQAAAAPSAKDVPIQSGTIEVDADVVVTFSYA